ncbi:sulfate-transporting ATPase [Flammeovirgaceae bacterium 311]|nr:sulfate-transporting ATPase [Flammeovirgaceae bacterium 311]
MDNAEIIRTKELSYFFHKDQQVLEGINLQVKRGSIYGFLGPNGAGKTTSLRLILGLLKAQQGSIHLFEKDINKSRIESLDRIGSLIEQPSLYGHLSAEENLRIYLKIYRAKESDIERVLKLVNLQDTGRKKARNFSLGMKQRLSIALALLHGPELLILDEPTNGLDPHGIVEIRELIRRLNRENGVSIMVSSHLLSEVERMATHVGIINKGKLLFQGTLQELQNMKVQQNRTHLDTSNNSAALQLLQKDYGAEQRNDRLVIPSLQKEVVAQLVRRLVQQNIDIYQLKSEQFDLEQLFMNLTSNQNQ